MDQGRQIRCVIVDDEPLARAKIREFLRSQPDMEIIGECENGLDAIKIVEKEKPDLLFLDIKMPKLDGFDTLRRIPTEKLPSIVFITAFDQYAIKAFDFHAIDYLLKPFDQDRFEETLRRIRQRMDTNELAQFRSTIGTLLQQLNESQQKPRKIAIREKGKTILLDMEEISWIETDRNYIDIHTAKDTYSVRKSLSEIYNQLDQRIFFKANRFTIINIDWIKEIQDYIKGELLIIMRDNKKLTIGRRGKKDLKRVIESI